MMLLGSFTFQCPFVSPYLSDLIGIRVWQSSFYYLMQTARMRVMLTITLSELMSDVQVTQMKPDGTLEESGEARRLHRTLEELADETMSPNLLRECGLPENALVAVPEGMAENHWSWSVVKYLSDNLLLALGASIEHSLMVTSCFQYFKINKQL